MPSDRAARRLVGTPALVSFATPYRDTQLVRVNRLLSRLIAAAACLAPLACATTTIPVRTLTDPDSAATIDGRAAFLKAHLKDGSVVVLHGWTLDSLGGVLTGTGQRYDLNRNVVGDSAVRISTDSVALYETNSLKQHRSVAALAVMTGISTAVTLACIADPKACFGSCPTFYVTDGTGEVLQAEGFSASIAPTLEATDLDALYRARPRGRTLDVRMTNEALETHVVRHVNVIAVPRSPGGRVLATQDGAFRESRRSVAPISCSAEEGDCLHALAAADGVERFSRADSTDLAARETLELVFPSMDGPTGIAIAARQTLLTTYVLYQALAYMGTSAAATLARLETSADARHAAGAIGRLLGGVEVQVLDSNGTWRSAGAITETGPLAADMKVIPLPLPFSGRWGQPPRVRLIATRGLWRLDQVALVSLDSARPPVRLQPTRVRRDGRDDVDALRALRDPDRTLVTLPGDEYSLSFELPRDGLSYELFLESRGYYLEWMRDEWLRDANPLRAAMLVLDPASSLRLMAPEFKRNEARMEEIFWNSRYVRR